MKATFTLRLVPLQTIFFHIRERWQGFGLLRRTDHTLSLLLAFLRC